jgi:hypothetical protein
VERQAEEARAKPVESRPEPAPETRARTVTTPGNPGMRRAGWVTLAAGGGLMISGVVLAALARSQEGIVQDAYAEGRDSPRRDWVVFGDTAEARARGRTLATGAVITTATGAAAILAGGLLVYFGLPRTTTVAALPAPGGFAIGGTF